MQNLEQSQNQQEESGNKIDILEIDRKCYKNKTFSSIYFLAYMKQHGKEMKDLYFIRKNPEIKKYILELHHFIENYEIN